MSDITMVTLDLVFELHVFVDARLAEDLPAIETRLLGRGGGWRMVSGVHTR